MHRFFVPPEAIKGDLVTLGGPILHQLRRVLRFRPGNPFIVLDNRGQEYHVELLDLSADRARARIIEKRPAQGETNVSVTLYQGLLRGSKFDFVLQKGTELGVTRFVPVLCERCVARVSAEAKNARLPRWQEILREAAEQSGRGRLPVVVPPVAFSEACRQAKGLGLLPWEGEKRLRISDAVSGREISSLSIFIGPEGGFTVEEVEEARSLGIIPVTLGKRILRAETAALVAVTAVLCHLGEL